MKKGRSDSSFARRHTLGPTNATSAKATFLRWLVFIIENKKTFKFHWKLLLTKTCYPSFNMKKMYRYTGS